MVAEAASIVAYSEPLSIVASRFLAACEKWMEDVDGCWLWRGSTNDGGYPTLTINYRKYYAHRIAYMLTYGPVPDALSVMHTCDVFYDPGDITYRRCVRPEHLALGTHQDNIADRDAKGRQARGTRNSQAVLTEADIPLIRRALRSGLTHREIALHFPVTEAAIQGIAVGRTWKHVPDEVME